MNNDYIINKLKGKIIFITGGTGSVGAALVKKLITYPIKKIIIFSRDENKQYKMRQKIKDNRIEFYIGDIKDTNSLLRAMNEDIDIVVHAAAMKQVPLCEDNPTEAVKTNIIGTENLLTVAAFLKIKQLIYLSSDKAVNPINIMGMTKKIEEKICYMKSLQHRNMCICGLRFSNILFSNGSVLPLFIEQIKNGEQLTITDYDMTRFIMNIGDAINLILYVMVYGESGNIYVKKCVCCKMSDIDVALSNIYSEYKGSKKIGIRKNEKMFETLISKEEMAFTKLNGDYFCINYQEKTLENDVQDYSSNNQNFILKDDLIDEINKLRMEYYDY